MVGSRMKSRGELQTMGPATEMKKPSIPSNGNEVLQEVDGCWNAAIAECQHRRQLCSSNRQQSSTSLPAQYLVVRQLQWSAAVQTPVNYHCQFEEHPIEDVKPVKLVDV